MSALPSINVAPNDYFGFKEDEDTGHVFLHMKGFAFIKSCSTMYEHRVRLGKQMLLGFGLCNVLSLPFGFLWQLWLAVLLLLTVIYGLVLFNKKTETIVEIDPAMGIVKAKAFKVGSRLIDWSDIRSVQVLEGANKAYFPRWYGRPKTQTVCAVLLFMNTREFAPSGDLARPVRLVDGIDPRTAFAVCDELEEMIRLAFKQTHDFKPDGVQHFSV